MEIGVLGPLAVADDGTPVVIRRARCRAVLAYLVSRHPDRVVAETLADALWPDADDDAKALNSARVHVHHLRQALPGRDAVLPPGDAGYRLLIPRDALDVVRFADAAVQARELAGAGRPREALERFEQALAVWRGDAYADFHGIHAFEAERVTLAEERLDVVLGYCRLLLDHGGADEVVRILPELVGTRHAREDLVACLMLAYFRCDRQRDALDLFGRVRADLAEFGLQPGEALVKLAETIVVEPESLSQHRTVLPVRGTRIGRRDTVVGREEERARLEQAWAAAVAGDPQLVYVHGVAGIGKSALVRRFVREHASADVAIGHCEPDAFGAYEPFPTLVREMLASGELASSPPALVAELARLAPDLEEALPDPAPSVDPGAGRQRLFDAVAAVLAEAHRPRLLVLEDLHWADADSIAMLRHVLRETRGQLLLLGTFRDDLDASRPFAGALRSARARVARPDVDIALGPMTDRDIAALVDVHAPAHHRVSWHADRGQLVDLIAGHPLRAVGVLEQLELEPDTPIADIVPQDVDSLVRRRLGATTESTQEVLRAASVVGREFSLPFVAAVAGFDVDETLRSIERAVDLELVVERPTLDQFAFAHPLYRTVVYRSMSNARQARVHLRAGERYDEMLTGGDLTVRWADVARHRATAAPLGDIARASHAAWRAAERAAGRFAHEEAAGWYEQALALAPDDAELRVRLRLSLGRELELCGRAAEAREHSFAALDAAMTLDCEVLVDALVAATPRIGVLEPDLGARLEPYVAAALARTPPDAASRIPLLRCAVNVGIYLDAGPLAGHLDELARLVDAHPTVEHRRTLLALRYMLAEGWSTGSGLDLAREICTYSTGPDMVVHRGLDDRRLLHELLRCGRTTDFDRHLDEMRRRAEATAIPLHRHWVAALGATRRLMRESGPEVEAAVDAAAVVGRRAGARDAQGLHTLQTFVLRYQQDRTREVTTGLQTPVDDAPPILAGISLLALSFAAAARYDRARPILDRIVTDEIRLPRNNFWFGAVAMLADVAAACGDGRQQGLLYDALVPIADQFVVFGTGGAVLGTGHHWLGRLALARGDIDTAREHLQCAATLCHRSDAPYWEQRAHADLDRVVG